jgi:hypothetical protein
VFLGAEDIQDGAFEFTGGEEAVAVLEGVFAHSDLRAHNVVVPQFNLLELYFGLEDVAVPDFAVGQKTLNAKDVIGPYFNFRGLEFVVIFDDDGRFLLYDVVVPEDKLLGFVLADDGA